MSRRSEILKATSEASRIFDHFPVGRRTSFDIIGAVTALDIPLIFRPLQKLWGATITLAPDLRGILITTVLDLPVQRFTLAHELGHVMLGHEISLDETIGFSGRFGSSSRPVHERAADTFASELLAPRGLMLSASRRHKWTTAALRDPQNVYQLALRLGISFQATCWALATQRVMTEGDARSLQQRSVKEIKRALTDDSSLTNPWANVWSLTEADSGTLLEAGPDDLFVISVTDRASAGFLWRLVETGSACEIFDERIAIDDRYGADTSRILFVRFTSPGVHRLAFEHRRPWNEQSIAHIDISIENYGKEPGGYARRVRQEALAVAGS